MSARAVLLLIRQTTLDDQRQTAAALGYANAHDLAVVGVTHEPRGAVDMVAAGEAAVLMCAVEPLGTGLPPWIAARVAECGGQLVIVRRNSYTARAVDTARAEMIRGAVERSGGDVELVARLLGVPLEEVRAVLVKERRPQRLRTPVSERKEVYQ